MRLSRSTAQIWFAICILMMSAFPPMVRATRNIVDDFTLLFIRTFLGGFVILMFDIIYFRASERFGATISEIKLFARGQKSPITRSQVEFMTYAAVLMAISPPFFVLAMRKAHGAFNPLLFVYLMPVVVAALFDQTWKKPINWVRGVALGLFSVLFMMHDPTSGALFDPDAVAFGGINGALFGLVVEVGGRLTLRYRLHAYLMGMMATTFVLCFFMLSRVPLLMNIIRFDLSFLLLVTLGLTFGASILLIGIIKERVQNFDMQLGFLSEPVFASCWMWLLRMDHFNLLRLIDGIGIIAILFQHAYHNRSLNIFRLILRLPARPTADQE